MERHGRLIHGNLIVEDTHIENERLELTNKDMHYFLGPGLTVRNCTLVLKISAQALFFRQVRFIDCVFDVKQELKNHQQWVRASLEGCRFKGKLTGCDFGDWPEYWGDGQRGSLQDCDFREARLESCRFMGCDERTLRFPRWPCFTLLDPMGHGEQLRRIQWPGEFGESLDLTLRKDPSQMKALSLFAPTEARRYETTEDALRSALEQLDCVVY